MERQGVNAVMRFHHRSVGVNDHTAFKPFEPRHGTQSLAPVLSERGAGLCLDRDKLPLPNKQEIHAAASQTIGSNPKRRTSSRSNRPPSSSGTKGCMNRYSARPASRLTPARFSLRALDPHRTKCNRFSSINLCTSFSRPGSRCTSSTITHRPAGTERHSLAKWPGFARILW